MFSKKLSHLVGKTRLIGIFMLLLINTVLPEENNYDDIDQKEKNFNIAVEEKTPPLPTADGNIALPTTPNPFKTTLRSTSNFMTTFHPELQYKSTSVIRSFLLRHMIIPDVLAISPSYILDVAYSRRSVVNLGNKLDPSLLQKKPRRVIWPMTKGTAYTLVLIDADVPARKTRFQSQRVHWLVINIPNDYIARGEQIMEYIGPLSKPKTGMHRYVFAVFKQYGRIQYNGTRLSAMSNKLSKDRIHFRIRDFAAEYKLGDPIAVNFFLSGWPMDQPVPLATVPTKRPWKPKDNFTGTVLPTTTGS